MKGPAAIIMGGILLVSAAPFGTATEMQDGPSPLYVDDRVVAAGVALFDGVDIQTVSLSPEDDAVAVRITTKGAAGAPITQWETGFHFYFSGDWVERGTLEAIVREGAIQYSLLSLVYADGSATFIDVEAAYDPAGATLTAHLPAWALEGDLEKPYFRVEFHPCVSLCIGGDRHVISDRAPDSAYYPDYDVGSGAWG